MESREQRIATLATTLRASGIATSDSHARMMAEDMIGVEEHVQRSYEVEHTRAQEYLQTVKNLGDPRQTAAQKPAVEPKQESKTPSRQFEELYVSKGSTAKQPPAPEYTSTNFGAKTLSQAFDHDTHNSALEAIKAEVSRKEFKPVDDIVPDSVVPQSMLHEDIEIVHDLDGPTEIKTPAESNIPLHEDIEIIHDVAPVVVEEKSSTIESVAEIEKIPEQVEQPAPEPKLDAQKLIDMMEEDGKLEEHTREIKEKPKDVKPKEAYAENSIDLGSMFDFNKGTARK